MSPKTTLFGLLVSCLLLPAAAHAQPPVETGRLVAATGRVEIRLQGAADWTAAALMHPIPQGASVRTLPDSRARILMADSTVLILGPGSELEINEYAFSKDRTNSLLTFFRGKMLAVVARLFNPEISRFEIRTPTAVAGVRGTYFFIEVSDEDGRTGISLLQGKVNVKNIFDAGGEGTDIVGGWSTLVMPGVQPNKPAQVDIERFTQSVNEINAYFYTAVQPTLDMQLVYADVFTRYPAQVKTEQAPGVEPSEAAQGVNMLAPPVQQEAFPPTDAVVPVQVKVNIPGSESGALGK